MKIEVSEFDNIFWLNLEPENLDEAAQLLRLSNTAKREPIEFVTHYSSKIFCEFGVKKKDHFRVSNIVRNIAKNSG